MIPYYVVEISGTSQKCLYKICRNEYGQSPLTTTHPLWLNVFLFIQPILRATDVYTAKFKHVHIGSRVMDLTLLPFVPAKGKKILTGPAGAVAHLLSQTFHILCGRTSVTWTLLLKNICSIEHTYPLPHNMVSVMWAAQAKLYKLERLCPTSLFPILMNLKNQWL